MTPFICLTCGAHFPPGDAPPSRCPICDEERQYIGHQGQRWTTLEAMRRDHRNLVQPIEPGLTGFTTEPKFAIGEQAHLIETPAGNVLWNCNSLLDDDTVAAVAERGGLAAIAVSHPHFYTSVAEWSRAFGGVPIYLHADDRQWVTRPDEAIVFWEGETRPSRTTHWQGEVREGIQGLGGEAFDPLPGSGLTLIRCGGHFAGSSVLHWPAGAEGRGALLTGDTIQVAPDRRWVSFMYSYPNMIPLGAADVRRIVAAIEPYDFDRLYGGWHESVVATDAKNAVRRSAERYIGRIGG
jgi:glyoxylase-like metal-dependent hydrolase (beta-lactamase superfamily II)